MTGWRLGWAAVNRDEIVNAIQILHGFLTVCASAITQKAALLGWTEEAEAYKQMLVIYIARVASSSSIYLKRKWTSGNSPEGAFYTMLDVRSLGDDIEIAEKCLRIV